MNEVLETIAKRSSTRGYTDEKLKKDEIDALINAALQSPTARNMQEVHITVVDGDAPILKEIDTERKMIMLADAPDEDTKAKIESNPNNFYYSAPTVFILSVDKDFRWNKVDAGIAVQSMSLAAQSMGLGSLIIGIIDKAMKGGKKDYFEKELKFPGNYEFAIAIAVGHSSVTKEPHEYNVETSVSYY